MSLVHDCFSGDRRACEQLYFWAYLWPKIRRDLLLPIRVTPEPPHPDWDPYALDSNIAAAAGGPDPEPAVRLRATTEFHGRLVKLTKELEKEIVELQNKKEEKNKRQKK